MLEKNLKALEKRFKPLHQVLLPHLAEPVCEVSALNNSEVVLQQMGDNPRLVCLIGFGPHVLDAMKRCQKHAGLLLVFEPSLRDFLAQLKATDYSALFLNQNFSLFVSDNFVSVAQYLSNVFGSIEVLKFAKALKCVVPPNFNNPEFASRLKQMIPAILGAQFNQFFSDPFDVFRGYQNVLANHKFISGAYTFQQFKDIYRGQTGVLVASGPSLINHLPVLKKWQKHFLMVACASAWPLLKQHGIVPDVVVHIERNDEDALLFKSVKATDEVFLLASVVSPEVVQNCGGPKIFLTPQAMQGMGTLQATYFGHSSAHAGFVALTEWGVKTIYMVGQDLCFDENHSHATGAWAGSQIKRPPHEQLVEATGYNQQKVWMTRSWFHFLKTYETRLIPAFKGQVFHVAGNISAKIHGTTFIKADEVQVSEIKTPFLDLLKNIKIHTTGFLHPLGENLSAIAQAEESFALTMKQRQFMDVMVNKDVERLPDYFAKISPEVFTHFSRYASLNSSLAQTYKTVLFPLMQGTLLNIFTQYFAANDEPDFNKAFKRFEMGHELAKTSAFWARAVKTLFLAQKPQGQD